MGIVPNLQFGSAPCLHKAFYTTYSFESDVVLFLFPARPSLQQVKKKDKIENHNILCAVISRLWSPYCKQEIFFFDIPSREITFVKKTITYQFGRQITAKLEDCNHYGEFKYVSASYYIFLDDLT